MNRTGCDDYRVELSDHDSIPSSFLSYRVKPSLYRAKPSLQFQDDILKPFSRADSRPKRSRLNAIDSLIRSYRLNQEKQSCYVGLRSGPDQKITESTRVRPRFEDSILQHDVLDVRGILDGSTGLNSCTSSRKRRKVTISCLKDKQDKTPKNS